MRVPYETMTREFERVLHKYGITGEDAKLSAKLYADASADGVYTHGLNRFPKFIKSIQQGAVDVTKRAVKVEGFGSMERWDGQRGPGNLNAWICTQRCIQLAKEHFADTYDGGESMLHLAQRIYNLLDELSQNDKTYLLVAHNGIARAVNSYFFDMTNESYGDFGIRNCELLEYKF